MTSDAKIGLLLGLVFIFVIAFVINGLPAFHDATNSSELTTNMVSSNQDSWGIGKNERKIQDGVDWTGKPIETPVAEPLEEVPVEPEQTEDVRFEMPIPENIAVVENPSIELTPELVEHTLAQSSDPIVQESPAAEQIAAAETVETIAIELPPVEKKTKPENRKSTKLPMPQIYVVCDGDNLASIAKKFYGPEEGNKLANSLKIYEANRNILESPDKLKIGQQIVVPPLGSPKLNDGKPENTFTGSLFEQAKSIGRKLLPPADKPEPKPQPAPAPGRMYIVQDGDYLWRIAAAQLGAGGRYKEILRLNADVLKDENTRLQPGMQLNLPAQ